MKQFLEDLKAEMWNYYINNSVILMIKMCPHSLPLYFFFKDGQTFFLWHSTLCEN